MTEPVPFVVGVRFSKIGKVYHFDGSKYPDLREGDAVIVETSRGWQLGMIAQLVKDVGAPPEGGWKPVERKATPRDLAMRQVWQRRESDVVLICKQRASEINLIGVKIVAAEYSFDGSRLSIMFSTESEEKAELKSLRQDMQRQFAPAQVELRQIGPRDVAKIIGGMGACGLECRCCSRFLTDFSSISIKMAKEQGISLTPTEITGMCGRLRCCLVYEYEHYVEARQQLPKRNKRVITPKGEGKVVDVFPLRQGVLVELPDIGVREFPKDEIQPADELEALQQKAQEPCGNNPDCKEARAQESPAQPADASPKEAATEENRPRGGSGTREGSPREGGTRDGGQRQGGQRDGNASRDNNPREGGNRRDGNPRSGTPRENNPREGGQRSGNPREGRSRDGHPRDNNPREGNPRDNRQREGGQRGTPRENNQQIETPNDGSPRDSSPREDDTDKEHGNRHGRRR